MAVVYQNRSYSTGTLRINSVYGKDSYAAKADYDGGYFDPPIDFAKEAEAAGAYGENVTDPGAGRSRALRRGLEGDPRGRPAGGDLGVAGEAAAEGLNRLPVMKRRDVLSLGFGVAAALAMPPRHAFAQAAGLPTIGIQQPASMALNSATGAGTSKLGAR